MASMPPTAGTADRDAGPPGPAPRDMAWVPGGSFWMGCEDFYPEEGPVHEARVDGFWMDEHLVTVAQFRRFVKDTGYVTLAERDPDPALYPDADPALLRAGALVFTPPPGPVELSDIRAWWSWVPGADWRHPEGPGSTLHGRERHPVTQVAYEDALAYATWAGKALPTEAEWERAARGGIERATYCWGDEPFPRGRVMANTWQGRFPWENLKRGRDKRTTPVKRFPANGFGLYDMAGNVWEWTTSRFTADHAGEASRGCCGPPGARAGEIERRVIKGGSHLCSPDYCLRFRPAARQGQTVDTATSHIGFRCIVRP
jgi:sulfatase modifying factor 1